MWRARHIHGAGVEEEKGEEVLVYRRGSWCEGRPARKGWAGKVSGGGAVSADEGADGGVART